MYTNAAQEAAGSGSPRKLQRVAGRRGDGTVRWRERDAAVCWSCCASWSGEDIVRFDLQGRFRSSDVLMPVVVFALCERCVVTIPFGSSSFLVLKSTVLGL